MQISDDLIRHITNELLKRLGPGGSLPKGPADKPRLCLVGPGDRLSTPGLAKLEERFEICEFRNWDDHLPQDSCFLITSLGIQALVRVAEGDEGCTVEGRALLFALLNGCPVAALRDGMVWRGYMSTAPKGLLNRYSHCETVLQGYGLRLVDESEISEALLGKGFTNTVPVPASVLPAPAQGRPPIVLKHTGRKVWSEADIIAACPPARGEGQTLTIGPADLMTPLAQDYVLAHKINLIKG